MSSTSTLTLRPLASTWSSPPEPMSYAQPSPPTIQTLCRTRWSATLAQVGRGRPGHVVQPALELAHPLALGPQLGLAHLRRRQDVVDELGAEIVAQLGEPAAGELELAVRGQAEAQAEFGVVLEQRVRPGRPAALRVGGPRRGRQVAAVDRRAAGGVGDHQPVAEQLGKQLQVRRLAASRAGTGELEQRLEELRAAHRPEVHPGAVGERERLEEGDVLALGVDDAARAHRC